MSSNAPDREEEHSVQEFAEQVVASLEPRQERYETRLGDDFYVCTFPNGLKTWVYVYEVNGYRRRRTLGTYPEMTLTDARDALFAARKLQQAEDSLIQRGLSEAVIRSGAGPAAAAPGPAANGVAPKRRGSLLGVVLGMVGAAVAGSAITLAILMQAPFFAGEDPAATRVATAGGNSPARDAGAARAASGGAPTEGTAGNGSGPGDAAAAPAGANPAGAGAAENSAAGAGDAAAAGAPADASPGGRGAGGGPRDPAPASAAGAATAPSAAAPGNLPIEAMLTPMSRELFVASVDAGVPGEELASRLALAADDARDVCYFTEVRNMVGASLSHRWRHDLEHVATIELETPRQWVAPLSSCIELRGDESHGNWRVELLDGEGEVVDYHLYEVVPPQEPGR